MADIDLRRHYAVKVASQLRRWLHSHKIKAWVRTWTEVVNPRIQIQCFPPDNRPLLGPQPEDIVFPDWLIDAVSQIGFNGYPPVFNDSDLVMYPSQWGILMSVNFE